MSITGRKGAVNSSALRLVTGNVQTTREFPYLTNACSLHNLSANEH